MNKKGFTLAELIGLLVILAALCLIMIPTITKSIKEGEEKAYNDQLDMIKNSLQSWIVDNVKPNKGESITMTLSQLKYSGLIDTSVINPKTEKEFPNDMELIITNNDGIIEYGFNTVGVNIEKYENLPSIKLNGSILEYVEIGEEYTDLGATAKDKENNELEVTVEGNDINTNLLGRHIIKYTVSDGSYTNTIYRNVIVRDTIGPKISYTTKNLKVELIYADTYDYLADVTTTDNSNGNVDIKVEKDFKPIEGIYSVKYIATDASGNTTTLYRKVIAGDDTGYVLIGDLNGDKIIDTVDASLVLQISACTLNSAPSVLPALLTAADTNKDGDVNAKDATLIGQYVVGDVNENTKYINTLTPINYDITVECTIESVDTSGANAPVLLDNMIPIKYENSKWIYADESEQWYNYTAKQWANGVVLNSGVTKSVGDEITEDDIALWYVWIPRYTYTIFNGNNEGVDEQVIDIKFETGTTSSGTVECVDAINTKDSEGNIIPISEVCTDTTNGSIINGTSTYTHPAFTFGDKELPGFWVGKFEVSGTTSAITIKPNVAPITSTKISAFFTAIQNIDTVYRTNGNNHMMKNMEWGAVAYLKQSKYGLGLIDIGTNNYKDGEYKTGCGAEVGNVNRKICNAYNTTKGMLASTTGNIYGVYDMSGGAWEYVMGNMVFSSGEFSIASSGFTTLPDAKYYDVYTNGESDETHGRGKLGDATKETLTIFGSTTSGWYGDYAYFLDGGIGNTGYWFSRGGHYAYDEDGGVFRYSGRDGRADTQVSTRAVAFK